MLTRRTPGSGGRTALRRRRLRQADRDLAGRVLAQKLSEMWGQQVVPDNRAGAGGIIGSEIVAKSEPDGHTLLVVALGYLLRVHAGVVLITVARFSPWLYICVTLGALFLGFGKRRGELLLMQADHNSSRRVLQEYSRLIQSLPPEDEGLLRAEDDLLRVFVDVHAVFGRQTADEDEGGPALSYEQYLFRYFRTLDSQGADHLLR